MLRHTIAIALVAGGIAIASPAQAQAQMRSLTRAGADVRISSPAPARRAPLSLHKAPKTVVAAVPSAPAAAISRGPAVVLPDGFGRRGAEPQRAQPVERGVKSTRAVRVEPAID